ncbi:hypothetical protein N9V07_03220 [Candidatus Pelagibacter sp.]|nr:hypothetical protein [Candidatus Pelagibacter sp.]
MKKFLMTIVLGFFLSVNSYADLYLSKSFNCSYYFTSVGEIKNKKYKVDIEKLQRFEFSIVNIDPNTKRALMVGNNGTDKMTVINTNLSGIHFLQVMPVGNMTMTTIYPEEVGMNELGHKLYTSSHSRHIAMSNRSLPQQFYGTCAKTE